MSGPKASKHSGEEKILAPAGNRGPVVQFVLNQFIEICLPDLTPL
jgi:hypothetical protein